MNDKSLTAIVKDQVKQSHLADYKKWLRTVHEKLASFKGFLGLEVVPPDTNSRQEKVIYHIIFRFDNYENLQKWEQSAFLAQRLNEASPFLHSSAHIQYIEGMELWYDMNSQQVNVQRPLFWKQVLVTIFTVYPLILGADFLLNLFFPLRSLPPQLSVFFTVIVVASLMVKPVMPFITRLMRNWLHRS